MVHSIGLGWAAYARAVRLMLHRALFLTHRNNSNRNGPLVEALELFLPATLSFWKNDFYITTLTLGGPNRCEWVRWYLIFSQMNY